VAGGRCPGHSSFVSSERVRTDRLRA